MPPLYLLVFYLTHVHIMNVCHLLLQILEFMHTLSPTADLYFPVYVTFVIVSILSDLLYVFMSPSIADFEPCVYVTFVFINILCVLLYVLCSHLQLQFLNVMCIPPLLL